MFIVVRNSDPRKLLATRAQRRCRSTPLAKCERLWCSCDLSIQISRMGLPGFPHSNGPPGHVPSLSRSRDGGKRAGFCRPSRQSPLSRHDREKNLNSQPPAHPARNGCSAFSMHSSAVTRLLEPRFAPRFIRGVSHIDCFKPKHVRNSTWSDNSFMTPGQVLHSKCARENFTARFRSRR